MNGAPGLVDGVPHSCVKARVNGAPEGRGHPMRACGWSWFCRVVSGEWGSFELWGEAGARGVGVDLGVDLEGEGEGGAAGGGWDAGLGAGADGAEEVFELEAKGLGAGDFGFGEREAGGGVLLGRRGWVGMGGAEGVGVLRLRAARFAQDDGWILRAV